MNTILIKELTEVMDYLRSLITGSEAPEEQNTIINYCFIIQKVIGVLKTTQTTIENNLHCIRDLSTEIRTLKAGNYESMLNKAKNEFIDNLISELEEMKR